MLRLGGSRLFCARNFRLGVGKNYRFSTLHQSEYSSNSQARNDPNKNPGDQQKNLSEIRTFFDDQGNCIKTQELRSWMELGGEESGANAVRWLVSFYNITVNPTSAHNVIRVFQTFKMKPDISSYITLIQGYCKNDQLKEALSVFQEAVDQGHKFNDANHTMLINLCLRSNKPAPAAHIAIQMRKVNQMPDMVTLHDLLKQLVLGEHFDLTTEVIRSIEESVSIQKLKFNDILSDAAWQNPRAIESLCRLLDSTNFSPDTKVYARLMGGYVRSDELPRALKLSENLQRRGLSLSYPQLNSLLSGCILNHETELANVYMDRILKLIPTTQRSVNNLVTVPLTTMVAGYIDTENFSAAFDILKKSKEVTGQCDLILLESLFQSSMKHSQVTIAKELVSEFVGDYESFDTPRSKDIFNNMCESIVYHLIQNQELDKAQELIESLKAKGYYNQNIIVRLFNSFTNDEEQRAIEYIKKFQKMGMDMQTAHYNMMINKCTSADPPLIDDAFVLYKYLNQSSNIPNASTHVLLLDALVHTKQFQKLQEFIEEISSNNRDIPSFYSLSNICKSAIEKFNSVDEVVLLIKLLSEKFSFEPDAECLLPLFSKAVENNNTDLIPSILSAANEQKFDLEALYRNSIKLLLENQDYPKAIQILQLYVNKTSNEIESYIPASIFKSLIDNNEIEECLRVLENFKGKFQIHYSVFPSLISHYVRSGNYKQADTIVDLLLEHGLEVDLAIFLAFVDGFSSKANIQEMIHSVDLLTKKGLRESTAIYSHMIQTCLQHKEYLAAKQLYVKMQEKDMHCDQDIVLALLQAFIAKNDSKSANQISDASTHLHPDQVNLIARYFFQTRHILLGVSLLEKCAEKDKFPHDDTLVSAFHIVSNTSASKAFSILNCIVKKEMNLMLLDYSRIIRNLLITPEIFKSNYKKLLDILSANLSPEEVQKVQESISSNLVTTPDKFLLYCDNIPNEVNVGRGNFLHFFDVCMKELCFKEAVEGYVKFGFDKTPLDCPVKDWDQFFHHADRKRKFKSSPGLVQNLVSIPFARPLTIRTFARMLDLAMNEHYREIKLFWETLAQTPESLQNISYKQAERMAKIFVKEGDIKNASLLCDLLPNHSNSLKRMMQNAANKKRTR